MGRGRAGQGQCAGDAACGASKIVGVVHVCKAVGSAGRGRTAAREGCPWEKGSKVEQDWDRLGASVACKMQAAAVWSLDKEC